jgi:UDP-N-acetylmuramyl pentapeptide phosphotransferase/UDP-N-acetylglucosamine-1-phosphate transferase
MLIIIIVGCISLILTWLLTRNNAVIRILDQPNTRSLHTIPTPRTGGVAILIALTFGYLLVRITTNFSDYTIDFIAVGIAILGIISLWEDAYGLSIYLRLLFHCCTAALLIIASLTIHELRIGNWYTSLPNWLDLSFTFIFTVWLINLYNFMDGIDGLAGGMAVIGFGALATLGWYADKNDFILINGMTATATAGFLVWNFPPARIFMGDSGSTVLGFLAAAMSLWGNHVKVFDLWMAILIFSPFIVDATVTLLRRLIAKEKIWQPHRTHYYQRLVSSGLGHFSVTVSMYLLMLACAATALIASHLSPTKHLWLITLWIILYGSLIAYIEIWLIQRQLKT